MPNSLEYTQYEHTCMGDTGDDNSAAFMGLNNRVETRLGLDLS